MLKNIDSGDIFFNWVDENGISDFIGIKIAYIKKVSQKTRSIALKFK